MTTFGSQDIGYKEIKNTLNNINSDFIMYKIFDPPYSHHSSPYIRNTANPGDTHSENRGRLSIDGDFTTPSTDGWVLWIGPGSTTYGNTTHTNQNNVDNPANAPYYYQIDVSSGGNIKNYVSGVVTKGRYNSSIFDDQYITQWKFQYSSDGSTWHWVDNGKIFNGNNDDSSEKNIIFSTPVYTVGIRFFPINFVSEISAKMALLIDHEIFDPPYNHHTSNATFRSLTSASEGIGMKNNMSGRLSETDKWWDGTTTEDYYVKSLFTLSNKSHYWQINVSVNNALKKVTGVVVKGRADTSVQYITQWNFTYSTDGSTWIDVPGGTYSGNFNNDETVFIFFSEPVLTTGIQFCPAAYYSYPSARMALLMSKEVKANELNDYEEIFDPPYTHHSSTANGIAIVGTDNSGLGRLSEMYNTSGWVIRIKTGSSSFSWATTTYINADNDEYYWQIDITADGKGKRLVKGVVTKGRRNGNYGIGGDRVTKLKLQYSNDGNNWYWVDGGYTFTGNDDPNINNFIYFTESVVTTGIRFFPTEYVSDPAMRMALILDNKLYSSALELSEPFNKKEVLDIEWGYRKGFASILENNKIHTLLAIDDLGTYGWRKTHLISKTSYPVENNIYELSLKLMENTITSYFFFGIHFDNEFGTNNDFFKNMGKYQLYSNDGGVRQRNYNSVGVDEGETVFADWNTISYNIFSKIIVDGINGKVQFVVNDVLQTTKEYDLTTSEKTGKFYVKIDGNQGKAVLRLRKLDNFSTTNLIKGVNPGDNIGELDIEWGTTTGFTSTKIAADGREKLYQLTSSSSGGWGSHKLISSTQYPMKDNIYILSLRKSSGDFFFGIDYTTNNSQDAANSYLHHFMKYQIYYTSNVTSRFYNEPHTEAASHGSTTNYFKNASNEDIVPNSNTYIDMILDGINGKVQFIINNVKQSFEYTMNYDDLNGHFYVKVDSSSINKTAYLSLRKYSSWQQINLSENYTETKNVAGIALKGLSDQTYIDEVKLHRICNKVEWNKITSGNNIEFHSDNSVTSTINISRTEAYFASKEKIYYSDKIQGVRFKVKNSGNNNNVMFGFGRNGYFIHKTQEAVAGGANPRYDINYAFYFDEHEGNQSTKLLTGSYPSDLGSDIANYDDTTIFDIKIEGTSVKFYINNVVQPGSYVVDYSHFPLYLMGTMNGEVTSLVVDDQNNELDLDNPDNITTITHSTTGVGYLITENFVETTTTVLKVLKFKFNEIQGLTNGGVKDYIGFGGSGTHTGINWYKNIQFGFRRGEGGTNSNNRNRIFICEYNGTSTTLMQQWGTTDDPIQTNTFEIQIFNNTVKYWKENTSGSRTLLHTSSNSLLSSNNQLFVKVNMTSANAVTSKIYNIELGNGSLPGSGVKEVEIVKVAPITKNLELVTDDEFTEKIEWYENGTAGKTKYMDITNNGTVLRRAKDALNTNWESYASSVDTFSFSNDYYQGIKCKAIHTTDWVLFGFKNKDDPATNNTDYIQYGFYINPYTRPNNIIRIYEGGYRNKDFKLSTIFNPGTPATLSHYSLDDTFEVRIKGMQVEYLINDVVIYYSEIPANSDYEFEFAITNWGSSLPDDSEQGWKYPTTHIHPGVKNVKKIKKYVSNIEWGTPTNFTIAGNSIVQSYNSLNNWDSKLKSITQIERNDDCWQGFQFQPYVESWGSSASTPYRNYIRLGLGNNDFSTDGNYDNEIEYLFYLKTDANDENIEIKHLSTSKWPSTRHYTPDDKFRIMVKGDTIRYIINDSIVYEQMISNGIKYPLYIKMTGTSSQRGVKNVKLITKDVEEKENHWSKNIVWGASLNMNIISNNYVVDSTDAGWNSYIKSTTSIERDDLNWQGIKFQPTKSYTNATITSPNRNYVMIDLSNPDFISSTNFHHELDYPYYLGPVGNKIEIGNYYGSNTGHKTILDFEYTEYDVFQIMVKGNQLRYIINGVIYYELTHDNIVYPLYIKMTTSSSYQGVRNLQILRSNVFKTNCVLDPNKQRNILFDKPIEANSISVTPLKWHNIPSNNYGEIKAIVSKQNIGNGDTIIYDPHYQYHSSNSHYLSSTNEMGSVTTNRGSLVKKIDGTWIPNHDVSLVATRENLLGESSGGEGPLHSGTNTGQGNIWYEVETSKNNECKNINAINVNTGSLGIHFQIEFHVAIGGGECRVSKNGNNIDVYEPYDGTTNPKRGINTWVFDSDGNHIDNHGIHWRDMYYSSSGRANWELWTSDVNNRNIGDIIVVSSKDYISAPEYPSNTWSFFDSYGSTVMKGQASEGGQLPYGDRYGCCCVFIYGKPELGIYEYVSAINQVAESPRDVYVYKDFIKTSGRNGYMTSFKLQYKNNSNQYVDLNSGSEYTFSSAPSNTVNDVTKTITFDPPLSAKSIRLFPLSWHNFITARINMKIKKNVNIQTQIRNTSFSNDVIYRGEMCEENVLDNKKYFQPQDSYTFNLFDSTNFVGSTGQHAGIGGAEVGEILVANIPFDIVDDLAISDVSWDSTASSNVDFNANGGIATTVSPEDLPLPDWWPAYAMSNDIIYQNDNVYQGIKFQKETLDSEFAIGLSLNHENWNGETNRYNDIDFTFVVRNQGHPNVIEIYEKDEYPNITVHISPTTPETTLEDIFEVRVKGTTIEYLKNNIVFYTSTNTASFPLYVRSAIKFGGIKNVQIYKYEQPTINPMITWDSTTFLNMALGTLDTTRISKTGSPGWNSFAMSSTQPIYRNDNIWQGVKFQFISGSKHVMVGLGNGIDTDVTDHGHIRQIFTIYLQPVYTNSANKVTIKYRDIDESGAIFTQQIYDTDIFEIRVKGTVVQYLKNNAVFYTSANTPSYPLYVKSSFYNENDGIKNVQIYYNPQNLSPLPPTLTWDSSNSSGINYQNGGIIKNTASTAYSISEQYFEYNPNLIQGVRFQVTHSSVHLFIGFGDGDWSESSGGSRSYADFQHNLHIRANDDPYYSVYNAGVSSGRPLLFPGGNHTPYTENDIFEIRIIGYSVEYLKNDVVFYKSTVTSVFPLYLKTRIDNVNDGFKNMERFSYNPQSTKKSLYTLEVESGKMGGYMIHHYKFYDTFIQKYSDNSWYLGFYSEDKDIKVINISLELIPNNKILLRYNGSGYATHDPPPEGWYNKMEDYYTTNRNNAYHLRKLVITIKKSNENNQQYNFERIIWDKDNDNNVRYENNNTELYNTYSGSFIAWDTYAISKTKIERNDNYWQVLSFQLGSTSSTHFTRLGIGHTTEWNIGGVGIIPHNYYQVDFQWYIRDNTNYQIQEGDITSYEPYASTGTHGGFASTSATISTYDIYEIRIKGDIVQYFRNGSLVYTSTKTPIYPLYIKYVTEFAGNLIPNQGVKNVQLYRKKIANTVSYGIKNAFKYSGDLTVGNYEEVYNNTDVVTSDISWDSTTFLNMALGTLDTTRISKTDSPGWNSFAMSSTQPIYRNDNIWQGVKFQFISGSKHVMVGLGNGIDTDVTDHGHIRQIFTIYLQPVYTNSANKVTIKYRDIDESGAIFTQQIYDTDIFEIRVKGTVVQYLKNNAVFYTSTNTPLYPLYVKSSFYNENDGIKNVQIYKQPIQWDLPEYNQQNIQWNLNKTKNIDFNADGSITRDPILGTGWNSWTVATEKIYQNNDVYQGIKCNANQTYGYVVFGLKNSEGNMADLNTSGLRTTTALTYGMDINAHTTIGGVGVDTNNAIRIRENNNIKKDFNERGAATNNPNNPSDGYLQNYTTDDILEVRVKGTQVEYLVNNVVIYYSTIEATFPLYPCIASWGACDFPNSPNSIGAAVGIKNIQLNINHSPYAAKSEFTWDTSNSHNIDFNSDGSITPKTISWESRTISHQLIHYNPNLIQGVRFQIRNTTGHEMMGLGVDTNWDVVGTSHYNAIHFATYFVPNLPTVQVYESDPTLGVSSSNISDQSSSFNIGNTTDDIFEVRVIGKTVEYVKNGEVYYTSANEAVFPLYVKACLSGYQGVSDGFGGYIGGFKNIELFKDRYPLRRVEWDENYSVNVKIDNTRKVIKNGNVNAWDSNCFSIQKIKRNETIWQGIRFQSIKENLQNYGMFGLGKYENALSTSPAYYYPNIKYAIYFWNHLSFPDDSLRVYEDGDHKGDYCNSSGGYSPNDLFEIRVKGEYVEYLKNGTVFRNNFTTTDEDGGTFSAPPFVTYPLYASGAFGWEPGTGVKNVDFFKHVEWDLQHSINMDFNNDGSITKPYTDKQGIFNSGTTSKDYILRDNDIYQGIKFKFKPDPSNKTFAMVGLSTDKEWNHTDDMQKDFDFGIYLGLDELDIEWGTTIGFTSTKIAADGREKLYQLTTHPGSYGAWGSHKLISSTSYPMKDNIYILSSKIVSGDFFFGIDNTIHHPTSPPTTYLTHFMRYQISYIQGVYESRLYSEPHTYSGSANVTTTLDTLRSDTYVDMILDGVNGKVNFMINNVKQDLEYTMNDNDLNGHFYVKVDSAGDTTSKTSYLSLRKYRSSTVGGTPFLSYNYPVTIPYMELDTQEELDIEWGTKTGGFTSTKIAADGREKLYQIMSGSTSGWKTNKLISSTSYPMKDNIYILSLKIDNNAAFFFGIDYTTNDGDPSGDNKHLHQYMKYNIYVAANGSCASRIYNPIGSDNWSETALDSSTNNTYMDIILDGINGKVNFMINNVKQDLEYTMNDNDLNGHFYVKVDFYTGNQTSYLSLRRYSGSNDMFEIRVKGTTIEYLKNGAVLYTSAKEATFPLYVKIALSQNETYADRGVQYVEMYSNDDLYNKCKQGENVLWDRSLHHNINYHSNFIGATATDSKSLAISLQSIQYNATVYQGIQFQLFNGGYCMVGLGRKYDSHTSLDKNYRFPEYSIYLRPNRIDGYSYAVIENDRDTNTKYHRWPYDGNWINEQRGYRYNDDDIWEIRVLGNTVEYLLNDEVFYTSEKSINAWPLHLIYAPNKQTSSSSDNPDYQGIRNVKFINYSKGFYLTDKNYFQNVRTPKKFYYDTIPTPTAANVPGSNRFLVNVIDKGDFPTSQRAGYPEYSTLAGGSETGGNRAYNDYYLCNVEMWQLPDGPSNGRYGTSAVDSLTNSPTYSLTYSGNYSEMPFHIRKNYLRPTSGYTYIIPRQNGDDKSIFLKSTWPHVNGGQDSKGLCVTFLNEDERPSLILDCGENKWVSGIVFGGSALSTGQQCWRHFTMKYGEDNVNWTNIEPSTSSLIDTNSISAYDDWNANENDGGTKYAVKTTELDRMFQFNNDSSSSGDWVLVSENMLFKKPVYGRYFKFTLFSWIWSPKCFVDLIFHFSNQIVPNNPVKMWKNVHDGHVSTKEDNNALQIFSKTVGSESIDGNKNVYRAKFSSDIVSETYSGNIVTKGIWFQFELNVGYQCMPSNIKMSYTNIDNVPRRFTLFGSNDSDVSMYPKTTSKWKEIKQCIFDISNNSMIDTVNKTITFDIDISIGYSYFRMVVTHINNSDTLSFYNLQLNGNVITAPVLYYFTSHTFTNCSATGKDGPTLANCKSSYSSALWASNPDYFHMTTQGIQEWTVPKTGLYRVECYGAGGYPSPDPYPDDLTDAQKADWVHYTFGAIIKRDLVFIIGEKYLILVGQQPSGKAGGHGGTFLAKGDTYQSAVPIIVAGGGGSINYPPSGDTATDLTEEYSKASLTRNGNNGNLGYGGGETNGQEQGYGGQAISPGGGVWGGGGGGGFYGNGVVNTSVFGGGYGVGFRNGGTGGDSAIDDSDTDGGFGGGGAGLSHNEPAGGGGYSGGGGGGYHGGVEIHTTRLGGGGGSFAIEDTNPYDSATHKGNGKVIITLLN